jgi:Tfp pilus assembly protein PilX
MMQCRIRQRAKPQADDLTVTPCSTARLRLRMESAARARHIRRGAVAVAAVILMVLVNLIIVGMVLVGARHQDATVNRVETTRAFYAAEAVMHMALRELSEDADFDGDGTVGRIETISPSIFLGASAGAEIEVGDAGTRISVHSSTERVDRRNELLLAITSGPGSYAYPGLVASYYVVGEPLWQLDHVNWAATPDAVAVVRDINWPSTSNSNRFWFGGPTNYYGARFVGWIHVPQSGTWEFETESDDGSSLHVNGELVVDNDGLHGMQRRSGSVDLAEGWHEFAVHYFENQNNHGLIARWRGPGEAQWTVIPPAVFSHTESQRTQPNAGVVGNQSIGMSNQAMIDTFNSAVGAYGGANILTDAAYVATNSVSPGAINMSGSSTIYGHARVGPGGNPNTGIVPAHANITGTRDAFDSQATVGQIILPDDVPGSSGNFSLSGNNSQSISANFRYNNFSMSNNTQLTINAPVVGRIDGDFSMSNNAAIELTGNAELTLYVYGSFSMSNNTEFNINTGDPSRIRIFMMGNNTSVNMSNQSELAAHVVNPTGTANLSNSGTIHGGIFCRQLNMSNQARIHVDRRTVPIDADGIGGLEILSWNEASPVP